MKVNGAKLRTTKPAFDFKFDKTRGFQNDFLRWLHEGDEQVVVVNSPTGSGKTAAFSELCRKKRKTLLIYPTNALLKQQKKVIEDEFESSAKILSGDKLSEKGYDRVQEMLGHVKGIAGENVILTNPDILQAIIQNSYVDPSQEAIEFFNHFDGVVYDEFHFYDEFEASGLLIQIKIITERVPDSKIVLSSATPNKTLINTVKNVLDIDIKEVESAYVDDEGDRFRFDTVVQRKRERIWEAREEVSKMIEEDAQDLEKGSEPNIAIVFNSAYHSNRFYEFLSEELPELYELTEKDNGYDTQQEEEVRPDVNPILITTKKGEVGLDYDIQKLVMEKPYTAESFIQRFGRAGRKSEAEVYIYNMNKLHWWTDEIEFPKFVEKVYESLPTKQTKSERLIDLAGLRAAHAIHDREEAYSEIRYDFGDVPNYEKWRSLLTAIDDVIDGKDGAFFEGYSKDIKNLFKFLNECTKVLHSLRGRNINYKIEYPRGDTTAITSYGLLSAFNHYRIEEVYEDRIKLIPKDPADDTQIKVTFPGYEKQYRNWSGSIRQLEEKLQDWLKRKISKANIDKETEATESLLGNFLSLTGITRSVLPKKIAYGNYEFQIKSSNVSQEVVIENGK